MDILNHITENLNKTIRVNTKDDGELIGLPYPYTTPCVEEVFICMYYWDTYFTNLGLIAQGNVQQAKNNADNMLYLVEKYGFMPNGNMTIYLNRSQPPFLFLMVKDVYEVLGDKEWLKKAYSGLCREYSFWQSERLAPNGLNFYGNYKAMNGDLVEDYSNNFKERSGGYIPEDENERIQIANTCMALYESGWDCCSRFDFDAQHYNPVDLNALLYGLESAMEEFANILENGQALLWRERANERKALMDKYLWCKEVGLYLDWNFKEEKHSKVKSVASLYPAFVGMIEMLGAEEKLAQNMLLPYGVACSVKGNYKFSLQWDYPNIWAPLQYITYKAFKNYGVNSLAKEIAKRYINLIEDNFKSTGNLWEKYDGVTGKVADQDYKAPTMMGWTAGVYLKFLEELK